MARVGIFMGAAMIQELVTKIVDVLPKIFSSYLLVENA